MWVGACSEVLRYLDERGTHTSDFLLDDVLVTPRCERTSACFCRQHIGVVQARSYLADVIFFPCAFCSVLHRSLSIRTGRPTTCAPRRALRAHPVQCRSNPVHSRARTTTAKRVSHFHLTPYRAVRASICRPAWDRPNRAVAAREDDMSGRD